MSVLDQLINHAKERVAYSKSQVPLERIIEKAFSTPSTKFAFEKALRRSELAFICECKKASPSKGVIEPNFQHVKIAKEYEDAGADCISVLTEPKWFLGSDAFLKEIAESVSIPCLRKDFVVDEYMLYEARFLGASATLLICSILSEEQLKRYIEICDSLGISALVEAHDADEIQKALNSKARIIGVNNRNLKDFTINVDNSISLRNLVPNDVIFVSESGIRNNTDVSRLREFGVNAVLIGETLMKAQNKKEKLAELKGSHDAH